MKSILYRMTVWVLLLVVWILLVLPIHPQEIIAGVVISLLIALMPLPNLSVFESIKYTPKKILYTILFIGVFLWEVFKSNIDVALRVIKPIIPIRPGIVKVKTHLRSSLGRLALANAITLTPGTITVDIIDEFLYIHWISVDAEDVDQATEKIVSHFEKYLEVIFG